jgi:1-acyl-sn-glycerol-3-phosphate acyltransferase
MAEFVYPPVVRTALLAFKALGTRFVMDGTEHVPREGGAVLASNHVSYLDFIFDGLAARPSGRLVRFMAKESVFRHRVSGPLMRGMHHIPVDREAGAGSYRNAVEALRNGEVVGVFPEATISRSFTIKDFKSGAARMAIEAPAPIVPMIVWGGQRIMTKGHPRDFKHRGRAISITLGEPLRPAPGDDPADVTRELRDRMSVLLDEVVKSHPQGPDNPDDTWWIPRHLGGTALTPDEARAIEDAERQERIARRRAST